MWTEMSLGFITDLNKYLDSPLNYGQAVEIELVLIFLLLNSGTMTVVEVASFWIFPNPSIQKTVKLKKSVENIYNKTR